MFSKPDLLPPAKEVEPGYAIEAGLEKSKTCAGTMSGMEATELLRLDRYKHPETFFQKRYRVIAGVDEVGRGCIAGPVVAAAVVLNNLQAKFIEDIADSKLLKKEARERLDKLIRKWAVAVAVGEVSNEEVDRINILQASFQAMRIALSRLAVQPDFVLVDGHLPIPQITLPQQALIQGDGRSKSIGAASIVAKVHRDRLMTEWHDKFPEYNFKQNKGYGTREHWEALTKVGPCLLHRMSFNGVTNGELGDIVQLELEA